MKKKVFSLICCVMLSLTTMAQEHLKFKGIPITGSMSSFCQQLKDKGFTQTGTEDNVKAFVGNFTGRKANVAVGATDDGKSVYSVVALFDASKEWNTLVNTYEYYKEIYTRKYGQPTNSVEKNARSEDGNTSSMLELNSGKVTYGSIWSTTGGTIEISIQKASMLFEGIVVINYRDSKNTENKIQKDMEDI
ncbi:MAG: hypothetical protein PHY71_02155 [Bacteroidaceae bacterium]|nr:hypothetical protein [Bacteroidaceae bacterium]